MGSFGFRGNDGKQGEGRVRNEKKEEARKGGNGAAQVECNLDL